MKESVPKCCVSVLFLMAAMVVSAVSVARAATPQDLLARYEKQARAAGIWPGGFSAARGRKIFTSRFGSGKPDTPSCTTCHTKNPRSSGRTRAGKVIAPMAHSANPKRFTDPKKVEKWFRRNCRSVMGRQCTPLEKGDYITFMLSQ